MSTVKDKSDVEAMRHSCAHVLAQAVLEMFPEAKLAIGPPIENGFYYDFDLPRTLIPEDLPLLEKKMKHIVKQNQKFVELEKDPGQAVEFLKSVGQDYKVELAEEFKERGDKITFYENIRPQDGKAMFVDLCAGPHVEHTGQVGAFKLTKIAGAYWRGDDTKPMLQRIYGACFATKEELDAHLHQLEEARKRDHRVLGKQLGLFTFSPIVGAGYPMFLPKGAQLIETLAEYITDMKKAHGFKFVRIPHVAKEDLYIRSGHMGKYDAMMPVMETADGERYVMKAMNCPHHFELYNSEMHSYKDLPLRYAENTAVYRNEKSGEVSGLLRVRSITQDDTHIFVAHEDIESEIDMLLDLTKELFGKFGFEDFKAQISIRDPKNPDKYFGDDELWSKAENRLIESVKRWGSEYVVEEGEAAFYGPKIDIMLRDAIGREWQLTTIQLDFNQPENFEMTYIGEDGKEHRPAVLHVALFGSFERFLAIIIEHYAGAFPAWLAPLQVRILPVAEKFLDYSKEVQVQLEKEGIRVDMDDSNETLGKKIRNAEMMKVPFMLVIGEKEVQEKTIAVRDYATKEQKDMNVSDLLQAIQQS